MNYKRIIALIIALFGVVLVIFANYEKGRIQMIEAKIQAHLAEGKKLFQGNPFDAAVGNAVTGSMEQQAAQEIAKYQQDLVWCLYGGIALIVIGGVGLFFFKNKKW